METLFKPPVIDQGTDQLIPESYTQSHGNINNQQTRLHLIIIPSQ
jgi:hypothetical protein